MHAMQEHIDFPLRSALKVKWQEKPCFTYPWHFHSEYEILYVIKGKGTSFVADSIEEFMSGDLVMLGSNLPHFWRSDEKYYNEKNKISYVVIQFPGDLFKDQFFQYPEFRIIRELLSRSFRGIRFFYPFSEMAGEKIMEIVQSSGFDRVILFLRFLQILAKTEMYKLLAGELYQDKNDSFIDDRLTKVLHFLSMNYQQKVELETVAGIANLHPSAFCRFFKEKTGKSLSEYLKNMRISYACKLLIDGNLSVTQICFESGFNNLSNFNRTFKQYTKMTPTQYSKHFSE